MIAGQALPGEARGGRKGAGRTGTGTGLTSTQMMDVELTSPLPAVSVDGEHRRFWVLGRLHGEPIGVCVVDPGAGSPVPVTGELSPDQFAASLWDRFGQPVRHRFAEAGLPEPGALTSDGLAADPASWPFLRRRSQALAGAPFISVIICTRDRPALVRNCLDSLARQDYPSFEVVVVDNAATTDATLSLVRRTRINAPRGEVRCRYVAEPRPGLSWARNTGLSAAAGEIVAFLDDDEEPDRDWLACVAAGFARSADVGCVTGMILPAELDTQAREWFELLGGHSKGRGFTAAIFREDGPQSPLYPLPPFGAGGNMAFRRQALNGIGGFDVALGSGTPARACEDTLALTLILLAGYRIAYEPAAMVRHHHRQDAADLGDQIYGYGVGLTAFYAALLRHRPGVLPGLLRLVPAAFGYFGGSGEPVTAPRQRVPVRIRLLQRWGMLIGPLAYVRSIRRQARVATAHGRQAAPARPA